jgi:hemolysin III
MIANDALLANLIGCTEPNGRSKPRLRGVSHQICFVAAVPLGVALALSAHGDMARFAAIAFAVSVAAMFGVSSLFHRIDWTPRASRWLARIDHTMIYALIAGTYTPVGLLAVHPGWRWPILGTAWGGALVAGASRLVWRSAPSWLAPVTYVTLGWIGILVFPQIVGRIGAAGALLLLGGGLAYTIGAMVYARQRPDPRPATFGYHEVFHALVVVAVACQYATIAFFVLPRG